MRSLEVIIAKNAEAAGREFAHALHDSDVDTTERIIDAQASEEAHAQSWIAQRLCYSYFWLGVKKGSHEA